MELARSFSGKPYCPRIMHGGRHGVHDLVAPGGLTGRGWRRESNGCRPRLGKEHLEEALAGELRPSSEDHPEAGSEAWINIAMIACSSRYMLPVYGRKLSSLGALQLGPPPDEVPAAPSNGNGMPRSRAPQY